jgi:hypothetical protein
VPVIPPKADAVDDAKQNRWHDQLVRYPKEKGQYAFQNKYGYGLRVRVEGKRAIQHTAVIGESA